MVFLYGDSIRGGYEQSLRRQLHGIAEVWTTGVINGRNSDVMADQILAMEISVANPIPALSEFDLVLVNAGLHDASAPFATDGVPTPVDRYESNIRAIIEFVALVNPSARLVLVTTTPHADRPGTVDAAARVREYNEVLLRLVGEYPNTSLCDLYQFTVETATPEDHADNVHFTREFSELQAGEVFATIYVELGVL